MVVTRLLQPSFFYMGGAPFGSRFFLVRTLIVVVNLAQETTMYYAVDYLCQWSAMCQAITNIPRKGSVDTLGRKK